MARSKKTEKVVELPPIPRFVWSPLGLVEVIEIEGLADSKTGEPLCGQWENGGRVIRLRQGLQAVAAWQTLWHELAHVVLHDAGTPLTEKQEESVCNAFGSFGASFILAGGRFPFGDPADD